MALFTLLYASRCTIPAEQAESATRDIVAISLPRNQKADVTGCLIFSAGNFAQILEGERSAVQGIMDRILRDDRHTDINILLEAEIARRRFAGWALGYAGPSSFVRDAISRPAMETVRRPSRGISDLVEMMVAFTAGR